MADDWGGGLVGHNGWTDWTPTGPVDYRGFIFNSYSTGSVQGDSLVGGLVGEHECGAIERSFRDVETSNEPNMCGYAYGCDPNYGKTTAEMHQQSTFTDWDFINTWNIGENQTYPYLRTVPASDINKDGIVNFLDVAILGEKWCEDNNP